MKVKRHASPETRAKLSAARKGKPWSEKRRAAGVRYGRPCSEATIAKMSAAKLGKKMSAETRAKMSAAHRGKPQTPEAREAHSRALLGKKHSAAHRLHNSLARRGRKLPPETRAKMSESQVAATLRGHGYIRGYYTPQKPSNRNPQHYRSSLELRFMQLLDADPSVLAWTYESSRVALEGGGFTVPDFLVERADSCEVVETKGSFFARTFIGSRRHVAAKAWAEAMGATYRLVTEKEVKS